MRAALKGAIVRIDVERDGGAYMLIGDGRLLPQPGGGGLTLEIAGSSSGGDSRARPGLSADDVPGAGPYGRGPGVASIDGRGDWIRTNAESARAGEGRASRTREWDRVAERQVREAARPKTGARQRWRIVCVRPGARSGTTCVEPSGQRISQRSMRVASPSPTWSASDDCAR